MKTVTFFLDNKRIQCSSERMIFDAAEQNGIYIPSLCRHPDLKPYGACRLCIVEDAETGKLLASCVTPVKEGQNLLTKSERVLRHRRNIVRLMMAEHAESCLVCNKGNRCLLRKVAAELDLAQQDLYPMPFSATPLSDDPLILRDHAKCILCGKCIRVCRELVGCGVFDFSKRGVDSRPSTVLDLPLEEAGCTHCGACVAACPTGALSKKSETETGTPQLYHESICGFCGVGCSIFYGITGGKIAETGPSHQKETVNGLSLCIKGQFACDYLNSNNRISDPMIRREGELVAVSWREAFDAAAGQLDTIRNQYGPQSIGFYGSSKCTNEENYLFQKLARIGLGTSNIDNGGALFGRELVRDLDTATNGITRVSRFSDIGKSDLILVIGSSPEKTVPVLNYHIRRAVSGGSRLALIGPANTGLARYAELTITPKGPVTSADAYALILCGIGSAICRRHNEDFQYINLFTRHYEELISWLESFKTEMVSEKTGIPESRLNALSELLQKKTVSFVIGNDILTHERGRDVTRAALNLSLLTGSIGGFGGNIYPVIMENNLTGAWDMGSVSDLLPGRYEISNNDARRFYNRAWATEIPESKGLQFTEMIRAAEAGDLKALYIMGENPMRSYPRDLIVKAFKQLDLLIVQDILLSETASVSHILLPGAAPAEKSGSFTNMEGRIQRFTRAVSPPGNAKEDFEILRQISDRLGMKPVTFSDTVEEISHIPLYSDLSAGPRGAWLRKPILEESSPDETSHLKIPFTKIDPVTDLPEDSSHPLTAIMDRPLIHSGSGTRTSLSENIKQARRNGDAILNETTGRALNLETGDHVRIYSESGEIVRRIQLHTAVAEEEILIPGGFHGNDGVVLFLSSKDGLFQFNSRCRVGLEKTVPPIDS